MSDDFAKARIVTELPGPKSREMLAKRLANVPQGVFYTVPVFADRAKGAMIQDVDGNVFIDFAGGIGVMNVGHSNPEIVEAVKAQADRFFHTSINVVMYESYVDVAKKLNEITPGDFPKKTMLVNSGAEAVENAVKIARYYTKRPAVITLENAFHGRTLLAMTLTSKVKPYKYGFGPFAPEIYRIPAPYCYRCAFGLQYPACGVKCADNLERVINLDLAPDKVACFIAEPVQGEGGFIVPPPEWFKKVREICTKYGILYVDDEIQAGFARTGKMFAIEHFGVVPDMVLTAKSLAAGLPLSAVTGPDEVMESVHVGGVGGTYSGNPLACVSALKAIEIIERDDFCGKSQVLGAKMMERFRAMQDRYSAIGEVRGLGSMIAVELVKDRTTKEPGAAEAGQVADACFKKGLIILKAGIYSNVIRVLVPLVITDEQLDQAMSIFEEAVASVG
ncbi:MAG: 4-aminobutyrate--2-oxoglutarate transaminase [Bacillota bacterium]